MTFTRGQPRRLITHFHKVAELVCQTGAAHKQCNNNTSNLLGKSNKTGMKCPGWHFMRSKPKCSVKGEVRAFQVPGVDFRGMRSQTKKTACVLTELSAACMSKAAANVSCDVHRVPLTCF